MILHFGLLFRILILFVAFPLSLLLRLRLREVVLKRVKWLTEHDRRRCEWVLFVGVHILLSADFIYTLYPCEALLLIYIRSIFICLTLFSNSHLCTIHCHNLVWIGPVMILFCYFLFSCMCWIGRLADLVERMRSNLLFVITMELLKELIDVICGCCLWVLRLLAASSLVSLTLLLILRRFSCSSLWVVIILVAVSQSD